MVDYSFIYSILSYKVSEKHDSEKHYTEKPVKNISSVNRETAHKRGEPITQTLRSSLSGKEFREFRSFLR